MQVIYVPKNSFMRMKYDMTHKHDCLVILKVVEMKFTSCSMFYIFTGSNQVISKVASWMVQNEDKESRIHLPINMDDWWIAQNTPEFLLTVLRSELLARKVPRAVQRRGAATPRRMELKMMYPVLM